MGSYLRARRSTLYMCAMNSLRDVLFISFFFAMPRSFRTPGTTGSPNSKYEHRRASTLLRNIQNIRICVGKKTYRFCNLRKGKDFNKKQLTLLKRCVTSLLCGPRVDLYIEKTVYIKTHKTAINRPVDHTGEENELKEISSLK